MVNFAAPSYNLSPGGRLSLSSGVAVQAADVVGGTTIYYVPYAHQGLGHLSGYLTAQISLALDSNAGHTGYHQSGKIFDIFVDGSTGTPRLVTGPAWTNSTTRSAAIDQTTVPGLWTNTATMTTKFDTTASTYSAPAGTLLLVGSFYATANGQTTVQLNPAAAAGGSNTFIALYNAYNSVQVFATSRDNTASWTYTNATYRNANASASNRITFLDGLGDTATMATYIANSGNANSDNRTGATFNTTGTPDLTGDLLVPAGVGLFSSTTPFSVARPTLGLNFWQAVEASGLGTGNWFGGGGASQQFQALVMHGSY